MEAGLKKKTCSGSRSGPAIVTWSFRGEWFTCGKTEHWETTQWCGGANEILGYRRFLLPLRVIRRERRKSVWEKALKLDTELFRKQKGWKQSGCGCVGCRVRPRCQGALQRKPKPGNSVQGFQWLRFLCYFMTQDVKECKLGKCCAVNFTQFSSLNVSVSWTWTICSKFLR